MNKAPVRVSYRCVERTLRDVILCNYREMSNNISTIPAFSPSITDAKVKLKKSKAINFEMKFSETFFIF
jgi:hypothetical protein